MQCSSGSGGHEDANSDGAMLSREERPEAVQVLTWCPTAEVHGHWCVCCYACGDWFFPKAEL